MTNKELIQTLSCLPKESIVFIDTEEPYSHTWLDKVEFYIARPSSVLNKQGKPIEPNASDQFQVILKPIKIPDITLDL